MKGGFGGIKGLIDLGQGLGEGGYRDFKDFGVF
jgi:hypothetical protein